MDLHRAVIAAALAFATPAFSQTYGQNPFAERATARVEEARNPLGDLHLRHALDSRRALGLTTDSTFVLINATDDGDGSSSARLQQLFQGVKVRSAELITHVDTVGNFQTVFDGLQRNIVIVTTPVLSAERALALVAGLRSHQRPYSWAPQTELLVEPLVESVLARTGRPAPAPTFDRTDPNSPLDDLDALAVVQRTVGHRLLWNVRTVEGREGFGESVTEMAHDVDAVQGSLVRERSTAETSIGTGQGRFSGPVSLSTSPAGNGFVMADAARNYHTRDDRDGAFSGANLDANNAWGDGLFYFGNLLSTIPNRQTAMVDGHFGASVYWDLLSHAFNRKGPNGNSYAVHVFAHAGTNPFIPSFIWDDASYSTVTGNISLGDGASRTALDCLGHEEGHGLNDFSASLSGSTGRGINESNSDIFGALTSVYLGGGGFAVSSTTIPPTSGTIKNAFVSVCSGRNLRRPTKGTGPGRSDYWFSGIENLSDEHDVGQPNNRAFFFLAQGASPFMKDDSYSLLLPWGMTGLGNDLAGRVWFDMLIHHLPSNPDYPAIRNAAFFSALLGFGPAPSVLKAVQNAYAGIGVGPKDGSYPADPPLINSVANNVTTQTAQTIPLPKTAVGAATPGKLRVFGAGSGSRFFRISLPKGASATIRLNSMLFNSDWDLFIKDELSQSPVPVTQVGGNGKFDMTTFQSGAGLDGLGESFVIEVRPITLPNGAGPFVLDIDRF